MTLQVQEEVYLATQEENTSWGSYKGQKVTPPATKETKGATDIDQVVSETNEDNDWVVPKKGSKELEEKETENLVQADKNQQGKAVKG